MTASDDRDLGQAAARGRARAPRAQAPAFGAELAEIRYSDGRTEVIAAPPWCEGTIEQLRNPSPLRGLGTLSQHLLSLAKG